jgi:hypothetical protein
MLYGNYSMQEWIDWLYELFVSVVTFVFSLFGFDLSKRTVEMGPSTPSDVEKEPVEKVEQVAKVEHVEPIAEPVEPAELP